MLILIITSHTIDCILKTIIQPPYSAFWISSPRTVDLTIPLLSAFTSGTSQVVGRLELGRRDEWRTLGEGHGRELSVLSASLRGVTKPEGLRYEYMLTLPTMANLAIPSGMISRFPVLSSVISSFIFLGISLLVLAVIFLPTMFRAPSVQPEQSADTVSLSGKPLRKPKRFFDSDGDSDSPDEKPPVSRPSKRNAGGRGRRSSTVSVNHSASNF